MEASSSNPPPKAIDLDDIGKIWEIYCLNHVDTQVSGGICVDPHGYILTTAVGIHDPNQEKDLGIKILKGRPYRSEHWHVLKVHYKKRNFNLSLLKVEEVDNNKFKYFDLELGGLTELDMGADLYSIQHICRAPFTYSSGFSCYCFPFEEVVYPDLNSTKSLQHNPDEKSREDVLSEDLPYLCVGHTLDREDSDEDKESEKVLDLDPTLNFLDPTLPVIQVENLGSTADGCLGSPVFDARGFLVGLYLYYQGKYQYVVPKPFLRMFFTHAVSLQRKAEEYHKNQEGIPISNKFTPRTNSYIPHFTDAWYAHGKLLRRLKDFGYDEVKVHTDSNCQFRALAELIYESQDMYEMVRMEVLEKLRSNGDYVHHVKKGYKKYVKKMAKSREWGDYITLQAAADTYTAKISLLTLHEDDENICITDIFPRDHHYKKEYLLSHWQKVYYCPVLKNQVGSGGGAGDG